MALQGVWCIFSTDEDKMITSYRIRIEDNDIIVDCYIAKTNNIIFEELRNRNYAIIFGKLRYTL